MTLDLGYVGDGYKFTGVYENYPANQRYKYNISYQGSDWIWEDGDYRTMPYSLTTDDEVSTWDSEPWNPIPGGNGTFTISFSDACKAAKQHKVIFTGNFTQDAWGDSDRVMTNNVDGTFTWTGAYPKNFMYKVIFRNEGEEDAWIGPADNWKFDGSTYEQTWRCD